MQFSGTPSWRISWGDDHAVSLALCVRDAAAVPAAAEIPPLVPAVAAL